MLLAAVLLPLGGFFAFRALFDDGAGNTASSTAEQVEALPEASAPKSELLVLADDDTRSAASAFPKTFGDFGEGSVQTRNMVFPGMNFDEYSLYLFYPSVSETDVPTDAQTPADPQEEGAAPATSVPAALVGTTIETAREGLRWHFTERDGVARAIESREGVELFVAGMEGSRGYQGVLRFQEVPGGVVVRGVVKEIPANEVDDLIAESQAQSAGAEIPADGPTDGVAPADSEDSSGEVTATTLPVTAP